MASLNKELAIKYILDKIGYGISVETAIGIIKMVLVAEDDHSDKSA